jgi:hypothetical protein
VGQQTGAGTEQVVQVGFKLLYELGERAKKLSVEVGLYREMAVQLAAQEGVEVPDFVKEEESGGLEEEQVGQLREWLGKLSLGRSAAGEETTRTTRVRGRTSSRKRARGGPGSGTSRGKRGDGRDDDGAVVR